MKTPAQNLPKPCPICREMHGTARGLSFDGRGINDCGVYRARLFTIPTGRLNEDGPQALGRMFAAAPEMLDALREAVKLLEPIVYKMDVKKGFHELNIFENCIKAAIRKAEGGK